jgi:hypothetical protein
MQKSYRSVHRLGLSPGSTLLISQSRASQGASQGSGTRGLKRILIIRPPTDVRMQKRVAAQISALWPFGQIDSCVPRAPRALCGPLDADTVLQDLGITREKD